MSDLLIKASNKTPLVEFLTTGELRMEGKSIPENCHEFYKPVLEWLNGIKNSPPRQINLMVKLDYINTSSSKTILNIIKTLQEIKDIHNIPIEIKWYYDSEDEDLLDEGESFKSFSKIPLTLVPY